MNGFRKKMSYNAIIYNYLENNPESTWKGDGGFHKSVSKEDLTEVYDAVHSDQGGICAYCEIYLKWPSVKFTDDFRIEHFHPENCGEVHTHNYSLDWNNLLGCCHGGSSKSSRSFGNDYSGKAYLSCDVPKGNKILDGKILNPLVDLPINVTFFDFNENGCVFVGDHCPEDMKVKAQATIDELNLDCLRLRRFREGIIEKLSERLDLELIDISDSAEINSKIDDLRNVLLGHNDKPEFYSTISWYLAP